MGYSGVAFARLNKEDRHDHAAITFTFCIEHRCDAWCSGSHLATMRW